MSTVRLAASLLAADFANLRGAVEELSDVVDMFHVDVMDGHFVPNIAIGPAVVSALRPITDRLLDVHLMVADPDGWIGPYRDAGADWMSVHVEAAIHLERTLSAIRETGARAGVALNPGTPLTGLEFVLEDGDFVLVMSVNPGFAGQRFLPRSLEKIIKLRAAIDNWGRDVEIEVDGGVDADNASDCARAGADILVAGSSVCGAADPPAAARQILEEAASVRL